MNNYYELRLLEHEFTDLLEGWIFDRAITPHKDVLECYLRNNGEARRLVFSANPEEIALFLDRYRPPKKSNVVDFFEELEESRIEAVELAEKDRLFYIRFNDRRRLLFKLYGNNPNACLVEGDTIRDAFKEPDRAVGSAPPAPQSPKFSQQVRPKASPKNQITELNPLLPRNLIPYLVDQYEVGNMEPGEVKSFVRMLTDEIRDNPSPRVLITGETCLWSEQVLDIDTEKSFTTVNECILFAYRNRVHYRRLNQKKERILSMLKRVLSKKRNQFEELSRADRHLERADRYEKYGHLLMAHAHESIEPGKEEIVVENLYNGDDRVEIPLNSEVDLAENAEHYYEKAKASRKSYHHARKQQGRVKGEIKSLKKLIDELAGIEDLPVLDKWIRENQGKLEKFGFGSGDSEQARSPFRKTKVGKYEIWIGKSAKSNDELTTLAHKEDIWLHARGVSGSHVVIRMGNRKDFPPKEVMLHTASYAAYYSKARGMKSVPVMITKKKYVRKPKGAGPGAVVVEREQVEMVPPRKPPEKNRSS